MSYAKWSLLAVQSLGILLSGFLVLVTFLDRNTVSARVQTFALGRVEAYADELWSEGLLQAETRGLAGLADRFRGEAEASHALRDKLVPALVQYAASEQCGGGCGGTVVTAVLLDSALVQRAAAMEIGESTVKDLLAQRFEETVEGLVKDLRRFGLVNLIALSLMAALTLLMERLRWQFFALSTLVTGYTAYAVHGYLFRQNWALAILTHSWAAPGYQIAMILVILLLVDWLFLRGWITRLVVNFFASALP